MTEHLIVVDDNDDPHHREEAQQTMLAPSRTDLVIVAQSSMVNSAPPSKTNLTLPSTKTAENVVKRSNSCIESKYKCNITSERLAFLRKTVDNAIKEHKVFTIKGGWAVVRKELLKRNWVEKSEPVYNKSRSSSAPNTEELISNLPAKQDWESPSAYVEKCERTIMSRMLQNYDVNFYWSMRKDQSDILHRSNAFKIISRFSKALFASKEGLALLLQQSYWYTEPNVASINFPRCYVLGFPDHFNMFVDDFRITACMGLLKWLIHHYDIKGKNEIISPEGTVPLSCIKFAIQRCNEHIESQKHLDIDKNYEKVWDHEWEQYMTNYYNIVHRNGLFCESKEYSLASLYVKAKNILIDMTKYWPEMCIDGMRNIWILKPGNKCRGRGIQLVKTIGDVEKVMSLKLKYVVQKYIEKPLLIYNTKFDIRQWFIVANAQPLTIWMYRESYLRFSSQIFNLENFHESLHLTNHAVQCKYPNVAQRDKSLPNDNMWDCHMFQTYLKQIGCKDKWSEVIFPGMREGIICAMLASQEVMDRRQNTFELYGADFMVSEDFKPWLIEINCSPDLTLSTSVTSRMCPKCLEDTLKVIIDKRRDPHADTGLFDLVYRQNLPRVPPYLGMNLQVRGKKLFRGRPKIRLQKDRERSKETEVPLQFSLYKKQDPGNLNSNNTNINNVSKSADSKRDASGLPRIASPAGRYKGPLIEDMIDNLKDSAAGNKTEQKDGSLTKQESAKKKQHDSGGKQRERVSKKDRPLCKQSKFNKIHFVCRKPNAKENIKFEDRMCKYYKVNSKNTSLGLFNEWASKKSKTFSSFPVHQQQQQQQQQKANVLWEKETVSILKGKNILQSAQSHDNVSNKILFDPTCFNLNLGNLLLPDDNANSN